MLLMLRIITDTLYEGNAAMCVTYFGTNIAKPLCFLHYYLQKECAHHTVSR